MQKGDGRPPPNQSIGVPTTGVTNHSIAQRRLGTQAQPLCWEDSPMHPQTDHSNRQSSLVSRGGSAPI